MSLPINDLSWVKLLAPQLWMLSWQEMSHYICKKKYDIEKKRPTQLSLDDNLTRDYIRIWPFDFEYSMAFIMYINKCATICVYLLGIIQIVIGKIQKVRCVKLKVFFRVGLSNQHLFNFLHFRDDFMMRAPQEKK